MAYPIQPPVENAWQVTGRALMQGGEVLGSMRDMIEKRKMALIAQRQAELDAQQKAEALEMQKQLQEQQIASSKSEMDLKAKDEARKAREAQRLQDLIEWGQKGKQIPTGQQIPSPTQTGQSVEPNLLNQGQSQEMDMIPEMRREDYTDQEFKDRYYRTVNPEKMISGQFGKGSAFESKWRFLKENLPEKTDEEITAMAMGGASSFDIGSHTIIRDAMGNEIGRFAKTISPDQQPYIKGQQAYASKEGAIRAQIENAEDLRIAEGEVSPKEKQDAGKRKINNVADEMIKSIDKLGELGGVTDASKSFGYNLGAYISQTGPAEFYQRVSGSPLKTAKDTRKQLTTMGLLAIKDAAGLGTTAMNTAAEMKIFLDVINSPEADIASQKRAVESFREAYGKYEAEKARVEGGNKQPNRQPTKITPPTNKRVTEQDIDNMTAEEFDAWERNNP
jgi:hypothetical protein